MEESEIESSSSELTTSDESNSEREKPTSNSDSDYFTAADEVNAMSDEDADSGEEPTKWSTKVQDGSSASDFSISIKDLKDLLEEGEKFALTPPESDSEDPSMPNLLADTSSDESEEEKTYFIESYNYDSMPKLEKSLVNKKPNMPISEKVNGKKLRVRTNPHIVDATDRPESDDEDLKNHYKDFYETDDEESEIGNFPDWEKSIPELDEARKSKNRKSKKKSKKIKVPTPLVPSSAMKTTSEKQRTKKKRLKQHRRERKQKLADE